MDAGCTALQSPGSRRDTTQRFMGTRCWSLNEIRASTHLLAVWDAEAMLLWLNFSVSWEKILVGRVNGVTFDVTWQPSEKVSAKSEVWIVNQGPAGFFTRPHQNNFEKGAPPERKRFLAEMAKKCRF